MEYVVYGTLFLMGIVWLVIGWRMSGVPVRPVLDLDATQNLLLDVCNYLDADADEEGSQFRERIMNEVLRIENFKNEEGANG